MPQTYAQEDRAVHTWSAVREPLNASERVTLLRMMACCLLADAAFVVALLLALR